jgi:hypothetical protein
MEGRIRAGILLNRVSCLPFTNALFVTFFHLNAHPVGKRGIGYQAGVWHRQTPAWGRRAACAPRVVQVSQQSPLSGGSLRETAGTWFPHTS